MMRNRRSGVEDLWTSKRTKQPTKLHGHGMRWRARHVDDDGHEHTKRFARKLDAQAWLDEQTAAKVSGRFVANSRSRITISELAESWIGTKTERKPKTVAGYRSLLDTLVLPRWGSTSVGEVKHEQVQAWITEMRSKGVRNESKGLSASRVIQAYQVLNGVLKYAVRLQRIAVNPADGIELPSKTITERVFLSHRQVDQLVSDMEQWAPLTLFLAYTGLRWGEATALRARNVDLARGRVQVTESVTRVGKDKIAGPPKTHAHRSVPMPDFVTEIVEEEMRGLDDDELVFGHPAGGYLTVEVYRSTFDKHRPDARMTPHDLRHTAASLAIQAGANVKAVQRMLGHATATMTLDRYGHLFDDDLDVLAKHLSEARAYSLRTEGAKSNVVPMKKPS